MTSLISIFNRIFRRQAKRDIYDERMIRLFERQIEAREAMGVKYCCHRSNDVERFDKRTPKVHYIRNFNTTWRTP